MVQNKENRARTVHCLIDAITILQMIQTSAKKNICILSAPTFNSENCIHYQYHLMCINRLRDSKITIQLIAPMAHPFPYLWFGRIFFCFLIFFNSSENIHDEQVFAIHCVTSIPNSLLVFAYNNRKWISAMCIGVYCTISLNDRKGIFHS